MSKSITLNKSMMPDAVNMKKNLLAWYALASTSPDAPDGIEWYQVAYNDCVALSRESGVELDVVIDVVGAVSPGMSWTKNILAAKWVIEAWKMSTVLEDRQATFLQSKIGVPHGWRNFNNAWGILDGTFSLTIKAEKTYRFADNIRYHQRSEFVTVDQHMIHIICDTGLRGSIGAGSHYRKLEAIVIEVAAQLGIKAHKLQALVWNYRVAMFAAGYDVNDLKALLESI